jgi:hypothetical protein
LWFNYKTWSVNDTGLTNVQPQNFSSIVFTAWYLAKHTDNFTFNSPYTLTLCMIACPHLDQNQTVLTQRRRPKLNVHSGTGDWSGNITKQVKVTRINWLCEALLEQRRFISINTLEPWGHYQRLGAVMPLLHTSSFRQARIWSVYRIPKPVRIVCSCKLLPGSSVPRAFLAWSIMMAWKY